MWMVSIKDIIKKNLIILKKLNFDIYQKNCHKC